MQMRYSRRRRLGLGMACSTATAGRRAWALLYITASSCIGRRRRCRLDGDGGCGRELLGVNEIDDHLCIAWTRARQQRWHPDSRKPLLLDVFLSSDPAAALGSNGGWRAC